MITKLIATVAGVVFSAMLAAPAAAATVYQATLSPEVGVISSGTGVATVVINGNLMTVSASFSGLISTTTSSHIHCCTSSPATGTAAVATVVPTFPLFPLGVTSGTFTETFDMTLASSYDSVFITAEGGTVGSAFAALLAGLNADEAYFDIHTQINPGGEISGFLTQVTPLPSALPLAATGFGLLGLLGWRRKRKTQAV
jgi:CHRD domain-containing protein